MKMNHLLTGIANNLRKDAPGNVDRMMAYAKAKKALLLSGDATEGKLIGLAEAFLDEERLPKELNQIKTDMPRGARMNASMDKERQAKFIRDENGTIWESHAQDMGEAIASKHAPDHELSLAELEELMEPDAAIDATNKRLDAQGAILDNLSSILG